jgi:hypothetical protein
MTKQKALMGVPVRLSAGCGINNNVGNKGEAKNKNEN